MSDERTVIVGGGLTGLAAAVDAARGGREVLLVERARELGGRGRSEGPEGFALNLGPHALYGRASELLERLGVEVSGATPRLSGLTMRLGARVVPLPTGALSLLGNTGLSPGDKWALARRLSAIFLGDPTPLERVTVAEWLRGCPPDARKVVEAFVRVATYTNAPDRVGAGLALRQIRAGARVRYVDGGWQRIADALEARARAAGVVVRTGAKLESIEEDAGRVRAVVIDGERIPCDAVILTTSPKAAVTLLGDRAPAELRAFAERAVPVRAACLDVALSTTPRRHPSLVLGVDRPTYLSVHSLTARLAPQDGAVIHVARYLAPGERVDAPAVRAELEAELDLAQPGWRDTLVHARWSPAMLVMHALPEAEHGGTAARPAVDATGIAGVRIAGDWVGPRGLLFDACLESAREAVESLRLAARAAA